MCPICRVLSPDFSAAAAPAAAAAATSIPEGGSLTGGGCQVSFARRLSPVWPAMVGSRVGSRLGCRRVGRRAWVSFLTLHGCS